MSLSKRSCYVCGRETTRRLISEPLLLPVCADRACTQRAASLPVTHCQRRLPGGHLCGVPASPQLELEGHRFCGVHFGAEWERHRPRAV